MEKLHENLDILLDWSIKFVPKLLMAILALIIGFWIVKKLLKGIDKAIQKSNVGPEISGFLNSMIEIALKFAVVLIAASFIGFEVSSLLGVLAAAAFAIGLALQGFMGNFASGITIVFFKPYKVGDWVEVAEKFGKVKNIQIFNTVIETPGQKTVIVPNGQVTDGVITNFSTIGKIKLEIEVTMPYAESYPKVQKVIREALADYDKIDHSSELEIGISNYDSHNITVLVRPKVNAEDFWEATFAVHEKIKAGFNKHNIQVAYSEGIELGDVGD